MALAVLIYHGTSFFGAVLVRRVFEVVVLALADNITNAAFVVFDGEFWVQKVFG